jgi:hypothetical protein
MRDLQPAREVGAEAVGHHALLDRDQGAAGEQNRLQHFLIESA